MTAGRKLFAAAALIAAGVGVAKLLGEPAATKHALHSAGEFIQNQIAGYQGASQPSPPLNALSAARLVPDFEKPDSIRTESKLPLVDVAPPLLAGQNAPAAVASSTEIPRDVATTFRPMAPRAQLRNEAPRPLAVESRLPNDLLTPNVPAPPPAQPATNTPPAGDTRQWPFDQLASPRSEPAAPFAPTIVASYNDAHDSAVTTPISPPPWPMDDDNDGPRKHVVVDGDSLARLAGRYLDDPRRSSEIFDANRGLLFDPDLLPIGVELTIPNRTDAAKVSASAPQSLMPRTVAIHAPMAIGRLVPVQPVPSTTGVMPRAQLARPMPVE